MCTWLADALVNVYIAVASEGHSTLFLILVDVIVVAYSVGKAWSAGAYVCVVRYGRIGRAQICHATVGQLNNLRE